MRGAALLLLLVGTAHADKPRETPTRIDVDRDDAPPGRTEFGFDGGAPVAGWGATLAGSVLDRPIVLASDDATTYPVRRRSTLALGGALALGDSVVVDLRLAGARQRGDRLALVGDPRPLDRTVPLDTRLGARFRVTGSDQRAAFVRAELTLPTGDDRDFAGHARYSLAWSLIGRALLPSRIVFAGVAGIRLRGAEVVVGDRLVGSELTGALGLAMPLPPVRPLWCGPDQVRMTVELVGALGDNVGASQSGARQGPSPLEARAGILVRPRPDLANVTIGVRGGRALVDDLGAPRFRIALELTYAP